MIIALFAAFPQELKHLRKRRSLVRDPHEPRLSSGAEKPRCEIIGIQTGIGVGNIATAFHRLLRVCRPDIVLSAGYGGALYENAAIGDTIWSSRVLLMRGDGVRQHERPFEDAVPGSDLGRRIGEKLCEGTVAREGSIVTVTEMTTKSEIADRIPGDLPFPVCDMESYHLAQLSFRNDVPFLAIRSITDRLNEDIPPAFLSVTDESGRYRFSRALGLLIARPSLIPASVRLRGNASKASRNLGNVVDSLSNILSSSLLENKSAGKAAGGATNYPGSATAM